MTATDLNALYPEGDWQSLMSDWQDSQSLVCEVSRDLADFKDLKRKVHLKTLRMMSIVSLDVMMVIIANAIWAYAITRRTSLLFSTFCIAMILMNTTWLFYSLWYRRGTWKSTGIDSLSFLKLTERRAEAGVRLAKSMVNWCMAVLIFVEVYLVIFAIIEWQATGIFPLRLLYLFLFEGAWLVGSIYLARVYGNKKQHEVDEMTRILKEVPI